MPLFTDYTERPNFLFHRDPRTKLVWLLAASVVGLTAASPFVPAALVGLILVSARTADLDMRAFRLIAGAVAGLALPLLALQALFRPGGTVVLSLGPFELTSEPIWITARVVLGLLCLSCAFLQFVLWTHPAELAQMLVRLGLQYRYAMLLGLALRFFPVLEQELGAILDAQAVRGMETRGVWRRASRMLFIMLPFCLRTIRRSGEVALAMEQRGYGYGPTRTFLRQLVFGRADAALTTLLIAAFATYWAARLLL